MSIKSLQQTTFALCMIIKATDSQRRRVNTPTEYTLKESPYGEPKFIIGGCYLFKN